MPPRSGSAAPVLAANTAFVRQNVDKIRTFEERLALSNSWWLPAPRSVPY